MPKALELQGQRFGKLLVIEYHSKDNAGNSLWLCKCDCGNESVLVGAKLKYGHVKSCGCFQRERIAQANKTHGMTNSPTYQAWRDMFTRCTNPNRRQWKDYGGRGIQVCERWEVFENFLADMGEKPEKMTLDRKDNSQHYTRENCKWATRKEQCRNKRNNHIVTIDGVAKCVAEWAEEHQLDCDTLYGRIKAGDSGQNLLRPVGSLLTLNGKTMRAKEWSKLLGIPEPTICARLKKGWLVGEVLEGGIPRR